MHVRNMSSASFNDSAFEGDANPPQNIESLEEQHAAAALALLDEQVVPEWDPEAQQQEWEEHYFAHEHVNVLAYNLNQQQVNIDHIWPVIPPDIEVTAVWEPWGSPNGQYVEWHPDILMPWGEYNSESGSDGSQQTQQFGFD